VCAEGYVEELKRQVNKSLAIQALQSCRLAPAIFSPNQWNVKVWVCHTLLDILPLYMSFIKSTRYNILAFLEGEGHMHFESDVCENLMESTTSSKHFQRLQQHLQQQQQ
jgi:hypothetical protein